MQKFLYYILQRRHAFATQVMMLISSIKFQVLGQNHVCLLRSKSYYTQFDLLQGKYGQDCSLSEFEGPILSVTTMMAMNLSFLIVFYRLLPTSFKIS